MVGDTVIDRFRPAAPLVIVWDGTVKERTVTVPELDAYQRTGGTCEPVASRRENLGLRYDSLQSRRVPA